MTDRKRHAPLVIESDEAAPARPDAAPAVPDAGRPAAMERIVAAAPARPSRLLRWGLSLVLALVGLVASVALWDFVNGLIARVPALGALAVALVAGLVLVLLVWSVKELAALGRIRRIDALQRQAREAVAAGDLGLARRVVAGLGGLYVSRPDVAWGRAEADRRATEATDADALLAEAERAYLSPLDDRARAEIEAAARQVATVTAIVPLALADVAAALFANLRMIRRIAEIYGGRSGTIGNWRLLRTVLAHLVATGAVAVGDDLIGSVAGGGVLSKLSRRFGEGIINGALTARVGVAALEVCRPLPFAALPRPGVTGLVRRALAGLFTGGRGQE